MSNNPFEKNIEKISVTLDTIIKKILISNYNNNYLDENQKKLKEKILKKLFELKNIIDNNDNNNLIKELKNFQIVKVKGDGTCLYHLK
jgi:hypothetical protein